VSRAGVGRTGGESLVAWDGGVKDPERQRSVKRTAGPSQRERHNDERRVTSATLSIYWDPLAALGE
jgi:hypothetical protein